MSWAKRSALTLLMDCFGAKGWLTTHTTYIHALALAHTDPDMHTKREGRTHASYLARRQREPIDRGGRALGSRGAKYLRPIRIVIADNELGQEVHAHPPHGLFRCQGLPNHIHNKHAHTHSHTQNQPHAHMERGTHTHSLPVAPPARTHRRKPTRFWEQKNRVSATHKDRHR